MIRPNFLVIGAPSSGTTSLYSYLKQHPQIFMSSVKEPHFFSFAGKEFEPTMIESYKQRRIDSLEEYQALFQGVSNEVAIGEASPSYIYTPSACQSIQQSIPDAKLIAILRNPVDRAYSNYMRCVRNNHEPITDFAEALRQEPARIQDNWPPKWFYKLKGFYYGQLKRYFETFDNSKIMVCLYEDLSDRPISLMQDIFRFLSVKTTFVPDISEKQNISFVPKNRTLKALLTKRHPVKSVIKPFIPKKLRHQAVNHLEDWNRCKPKLSPKLRKQLIEEYREDILKLQELIMRDLSGWLQY